MIRIYDANREEQISPNVMYTKNPNLYNLNDWVIVNRDYKIIDEGEITPYVYISYYDKDMIIDDRYEIIICQNKEQVKSLFNTSIENKMVYLLDNYHIKNISTIIPQIVINTFAGEQQIKTNYRNLYMEDGKLGYAIQVNRQFYHDTLAFLKLNQDNNNALFITCEFATDELYSQIGIHDQLDLTGLEFLDSVIVSFNICDMFNRYSVLTNLVIDFEVLKLFEPINKENRLEHLSFARKAYLTVTGVRDESDIIVIGSDEISVAANRVNNITVPKGMKISFRNRENLQVTLRNYFHEQSKFYTNIKRQKRAKSVDDTTRLIIIYDPLDRGFVNAIRRDNSYEIALNKLFSYEQIKAFASNYAKYLGVTNKNIVYVLDNSVFKDSRPIDEPNLFITSGYNIKNTIFNMADQYNFTNIGMSNVENRVRKMMICQLGVNPQTNIYTIKVPDECQSGKAFIKIIGDYYFIHEAIRLEDGMVHLYPTFFNEVLEVSSNISIQVEIYFDEQIYTSNLFELLVWDGGLKPNYYLENLAIYTVYENHNYNQKEIDRVAKRFDNADVFFVEYGNSKDFETYVNRRYGIYDITKNQYELLFPTYLQSLGYTHFLFLNNKSIYEYDANFFEIDTNILKVKTLHGDAYNLHSFDQVHYILMAIGEYRKLLNELSMDRVIGYGLGITTIDDASELAPVISFEHEVSPWQQDNIEIFNKYVEKGYFLNVELFELAKYASDLDVYLIAIDKLIRRNNKLLNIGERQKKLSIVITTYCNEEAIYSTLSYIVNSIPLVSRDYEILIFDDCSKDNTISEVNLFFEHHPHVTKYVSVNERNMRYPGFGANKGIQMARGKYIHIVDGDDKVINSVYNVLNDNELNADLISFGHYNYDVVRNEYIAARYYSKINFTDEYPYQNSKKNYGMLQANVTHWNKFFKSDFIHKNSLYYLENQLVQDSAFLTDVYYCKPTIEHFPVMGYVYHIGHTSVSSSRKGAKLFKDFVNSNMKRTPLVNSLFPQYTYTMKRFMIYDEIKPEELEHIVDILSEKYATNYRVKSLDFFNKMQFLYKMMHYLLLIKDYDRVRKFIIYTEDFKKLSGYEDSKYYDYFLNVNRNEAISHFIVNCKIFFDLFEEEISEGREIVDHFITYYNTVKEKIENESTKIIDIVVNDYWKYKDIFEYIVVNMEIVIKLIESFRDDNNLEPLKFETPAINYEKTVNKVVVIRSCNEYIEKRLMEIDEEMVIFELDDENDSTIINNLKQVHQTFKNVNCFVLMLDGRNDIDFNNLYLIYNTSYSLGNSVIKLCEKDDMFNIGNRYLINPSMYSEKQFSHLSIFDSHKIYRKTESIVHDSNQFNFLNPSSIAMGYEKPDSHNIEHLNNLYHNSEILRATEYEERRKANMYIFDFNVEE